MRRLLSHSNAQTTPEPVLTRSRYLTFDLNRHAPTQTGRSLRTEQL